MTTTNVAREIEARLGHAFGEQRVYAGPTSGLVVCVCGTCGAHVVIRVTTGDAGGWATMRSCAALVAWHKEREAAERARSARWERRARSAR